VEDTPALVIDGDQIAAGRNLFRFDQVFSGNTSQEEMYVNLVRPLVAQVGGTAKQILFSVKILSGDLFWGCPHPLPPP
jgi:hypothetical protein